LLQRLRNAPEGIAGEHRRRALYRHESLRAEMARDGTVKGGSVKLAERVIRGVWKIDDDEVEIIRVRIDPRECVGVDDVNAWKKAMICR